MICKACGAQVDNGGRFCPNCGAQVEAEQTFQQPQTTQQFTAPQNEQPQYQQQAPQYEQPQYQQQAPQYEQPQYQQQAQYQQPQYQQAQYEQPVQPIQPGQQMNQQPALPKSRVTAGVLGILLGGLGIHNFYLGYTGKAVAQLLISVLSCGTLAIVSSIWGLVEGIQILTGAISVDGHGMPIQD